MIYVFHLEIWSPISSNPTCIMIKSEHNYTIFVLGASAASNIEIQTKSYIDLRLIGLLFLRFCCFGLVKLQAFLLQKFKVDDCIYLLLPLAFCLFFLFQVQALDRFQVGGQLAYAPGLEASFAQLHFKVKPTFYEIIIIQFKKIQFFFLNFFFLYATN